MEHFYRNIDGWFAFEQLYRDVVAKAPDGAHFVEIGAFRGRSAAFMAVEIINSGKNIRFDVVDAWNAGVCLQETTTRHLKEMRQVDVDWDAIYQEFLDNISPVKDRINIYRMPSVEAGKLYPDRSLDFVLIDGCHCSNCIQQDIATWHPKIKNNGILAGDDYKYRPVYDAVNERFDKITEESWWTTKVKFPKSSKKKT